MCKLYGHITCLWSAANVSGNTKSEIPLNERTMALNAHAYNPSYRRDWNTKWISWWKREKENWALRTRNNTFRIVCSVVLYVHVLVLVQHKTWLSIVAYIVCFASSHICIHICILFHYIFFFVLLILCIQIV